MKRFKAPWICPLLFGVSLHIAADARAVEPPEAVATSVLVEVQQQGQDDGKAGRPLKSVSDLSVLFSADAEKSLVPFKRVQSAYQNAYDRALANRPWWSNYTPNVGWAVAGILALLVIGGEFLKKKITSCYEWLWESAYRRLAGTRAFRRLALRRYRAAVVRQNASVNIPFRPDRPLDMDKVFVRLQVSGSGLSSATAAEFALEKTFASVVLGPPGSGKSMLLRKLALDRTRGRNNFRRRIPVLVELSRFNEGGGNLEDRIVAAFNQNDFPKAHRFVQAGLKRGFLFLLLDGLDEVGSEKQGDGSSARDRVVEQIRDLIRTYPNCKFLVTCRTAVYHGELDDSIDRSLSIIEFDDQQIQSFMMAWAPEMPPEKSSEQLLRNLAERPRILALARNPLMLTIVAFLYTDTEFVLPHSRAEFYAKAVTLLLEQWKIKRNAFRGPHKAIVLQQLALWNQDRAESGSADRRTMELEAVLKEIRAILPTLTLREEDAQPLVDEITERSGLLLALDGGQRYQFSHLTLQEFLAAQQLQGNGGELLSRYQAGPDDWRETVKLWCGLPHDSTQFIETLRKRDPVLAFECVSDAEQVSDGTWRSLLDQFKPRLGSSGAQGEAIVRSFALVAADPRPRGHAALEHLRQVLQGLITSNVATFAAVCRALTLTNLPQAAEWLALQAKSDTRVREYLPLMGDLAVPVLAPIAEMVDEQEGAEQSAEWPVRALHGIGTISAARALVKILEDGRSEAARTASAWAIASLVKNPTIEATLEKIPVRPDATLREWLWIWEPFSVPNSASTRIMAKVARALADDKAATAVPDAIPDNRIAVPHCLISRRPIMTPAQVKARNKMMKRVAATKHEPSRANRIHAWMRRTLEGDYADSSTMRMLQAIPDSSRFAIMTLDSVCTREQWQNAATPVTYRFWGSWQSRASLTICLCIIVTGTIKAGLEWHRAWPSWLGWVAAVLMAAAALAVVAKAIKIGRTGEDDDSWSPFLFAAACTLMFGASVGFFAPLSSKSVGWSSRPLVALASLLAAGFVAGIVAIFHEFRWARRRALRRSFAIPFLVASLVPPALVGLTRLTLQWLGLGSNGTNSVFLMTPVWIVIPLVTGTVITFVSDDGWHAAFVQFVLSLGIAMYTLSVCGSYAIGFMVDLTDDVFRTTIILALLNALFAFCFGSAFHRHRLANNPFHALLTGEKEADEMDSIKQRFRGLAAFARGTS